MQKQPERKPYLVVIGTAARTGQGGISTALPGYFEALKRAGIAHVFVSSHEGGSGLRKLRVYLSALRQVTLLVHEASNNQLTPILYVHIGPWFSMLRKLSFVWLGKLLGAKVICQVHSPALDSYLNRTVAKLACTLFFAQMDKVLVLSEWWRARLGDSGVKRLAIVPNPLGEDFERVAQQVVAESKKIYNQQAIQLLCMSRLVKGKGVELAIQSLVYLPIQYRLTIAGAGLLLDELRSLSNKLGLTERVTFLGWVSGDDRLTLFEKHDVFLLPSQNDSFGMGFVEAMAYGLPVVALKWGAIADVVANDKAGFLVDKPNAELIAVALKQLATPAKRKEMGAFGKQWVLQKFSINSVAIKLGAVVNSVLHDKSSL
jgi:glycosyltransferase involved in cell wall biosynthesis